MGIKDRILREFSGLKGKLYLAALSFAGIGIYGLVQEDPAFQATSTIWNGSVAIGIALALLAVIFVAPKKR